MTANKSPYFRKVIAILTVVMAFFIFSCEKKVILKEPPLKEPVSKKPPEKKVVIDHFAIAEGYWDQKEYDKAFAAYERYLKAFPSGDRVRDALARKAAIYYDRNQYEEGLPLLLEVIDEYPLNEKGLRFTF